MKQRLFRLILLASIAAVSLGSTLMISSGDAPDARVVHVGK